MEIKGLKAVEYLNNELSILNSQVIEIRMVSTIENYDIILFLKVKEIIIEIYFENILEFSFYHNSTHIFYNVEDYKMIYHKDLEEYYLSLDPNDDFDNICEADGDFLKAKYMKVKINI